MTVPVRPLTGMQPGTQPGQSGQQQQPHPTVGNLGLPGAPVTIEQSRQVQAPIQQPQQPAWQMPPMPQQQQQTFEQQPQQQPQQQQPQYTQQNPPPNNQPVQRVNIPDHVILDGDGVPPHLRGRTWGQVKQIHTALEQDFVQRQQRPAAQQQQSVPQQRQQTGGRPQPQTEGATDFWADPVGAIRSIVTEQVGQAIAPVTQRTTAMAIQEAQSIARQGIPDFQHLEAEVIQSISGLAPEALADPRTWQNAADLARGRMMSRGQYQPQQQQQQPQIHQPQQQRGPGVFVPAPVNPIGAFFTEPSTPPGQQGSVSTLTNDEQYYAQKMGMTNEEYAAWRGGVVSNSNARRF